MFCQTKIRNNYSSLQNSLNSIPIKNGPNNKLQRKTRTKNKTEAAEPSIQTAISRNWNPVLRGQFQTTTSKLFCNISMRNLSPLRKVQPNFDSALSMHYWIDTVKGGYCADGKRAMADGCCKTGTPKVSRKYGLHCSGALFSISSLKLCIDSHFASGWFISA